MIITSIHSPQDFNTFVKSLQLFPKEISVEQLVKKIRDLNLLETIPRGLKYKCFLGSLRKLLTLCKGNSLHLFEIFLEFAIKSQNPSITLDLLEDFVLEDNILTADVETLLKFLYYKGIILVMVRQREDALNEFKKVLVVPSSVASQIQVEAFKKILLLELLISCDKNTCFGKNKTTPPGGVFVSGAIGRVILGEAEKYLEFTQIFRSRNLKKIKDFLEKEGDMFKRQGNYGLLKQILSSENFVRNYVEKLEKVYSRISKNSNEILNFRILRFKENSKDLALEEVSLNEFETFITNVSLETRTNVIIDDRSGEILFKEKSFSKSFKDISQKLQDIFEQFNQLNRTIELSEEYMARVVSRSEMVQSRLFDDRLQEMDF